MAALRASFRPLFGTLISSVLVPQALKDRSATPPSDLDTWINGCREAMEDTPSGTSSTSESYFFEGQLSQQVGVSPASTREDYGVRPKICRLRVAVQRICLRTS